MANDDGKDDTATGTMANTTNDESSMSSPCKKKAKTMTATTFEDVLDPRVRTEAREAQIQQDYLSSKPYHHARIENIFHVDFLTACKEQIKQHSKVNFKETDLFRVYQSVDLANLVPNSDDAQQMSAVMQLREVLYSQEWRSYMERLTQLPPGTLSDQVDCACNCHAPGCHLLCHDDVIGTRKISYILYLTEPDWTDDEGGALELYDSYASASDGPTPNTGSAASSSSAAKEDVARREPKTCPSKTLLPLFNSMAFFVVEPGVSFHAVQEVLGDRPRLSVQGWYHAASVPEHVEHATLNRLKEQSTTTTNNSKNSSSEQNTTQQDDGFIPLKDERVQPLEQQRKQRAANADKLLDSDRDYLALYVNETYLTKTSMEEIRERFEEDSSVQLRHFFRTSWTQQIKKAIEGHDADARPKVGQEGYYEWGVSDEWKIAGPPHKQRYLQYQANQENGSKPSATKNASTKDPLAQALPPQTTSAGLLMDQLKQKVMQSPAFARYLNYITSLGVPLGYKGEVRRFRPGLDYTVAHYGILTQTAVLDATICFVAGTGGMGAPAAAPTDSSDTTAAAAAVAASKQNGAQEDSNVSDPEDEDFDEADVLWQSDDVGGFECYIEADDYEKEGENDEEMQGDEDEEAAGKADNGDNVPAAKAPSSEPADEYNAEDDTNLLSVSASNNTLSLVYRDPGTMRFIKYVGSRAPSSRWDISMEYQVPDDERDDP